MYFLDWDRRHCNRPVKREQGLISGKGPEIGRVTEMTVLVLITRLVRWENGRSDGGVKPVTVTVGMVSAETQEGQQTLLAKETRQRGHSGFELNMVMGPQ